MGPECGWCNVSMRKEFFQISPTDYKGPFVLKETWVCPNQKSHDDPERMRIIKR